MSLNCLGSRLVSRLPQSPLFSRSPLVSLTRVTRSVFKSVPVPNSVFAASCAAGVLAVALGLSAPAMAQTAGQASAPMMGGSATAAASDARAVDTSGGMNTGNADSSASTAAQDNAFDARQKVLDQRSEENNYRYGVAEHDCYSKFFVNYCLNKARDSMRVVQADIRKEQLALDGEQRAQRARDRDEQAAIKRAQDEASAPQRAAEDARNTQAYQDKQRQHQLDQAQRTAEAPQRSANAQAYQDKQRQHALDQAQRGVSPSQAAANQQAYDQKQGDFQRKLEEARQQGAQKAQERVEKQQSFEKKQVDAAQHKADVESRQKQAADKAEQKRQDQLKQQQELEQQQKLQQEQQ
ncbi:hypothetical protein B0G83_102387 [Paraburkholderia sp. BL21I4N1]|nr:hypothetical protein B0G83_102387 [Paraburkholderia sp. BL21I4N1]